MKYAIDIALLPPENIMDICIKLNQKDSKIMSVLNKTDNFPHITLAMGITDDDGLQKINLKLEKITKTFQPLELEIFELYHKTDPNNKKSAGFSIRPAEQLVDLHQIIMRELSPIFSYKVELDMFYKDQNETISMISKSWVKNYKKNHVKPADYRPHLSLKCSQAKLQDLPIKFLATRLVVSQLGNYCTCRKIFKEFTLK